MPWNCSRSKAQLPRAGASLPPLLRTDVGNCSACHQSGRCQAPPDHAGASGGARPCSVRASRRARTTRRSHIGIVNGITIDYRTGDPARLADTERKLGDAVTQLESTAKLLGESHPAFGHIPKQLPIRGLVVTLEPFYPQGAMGEGLVRSEVLPIGAVSAYELELIAAALTDQADAGAQILAALTRYDGLMPTSPTWRTGAHFRRTRSSPALGTDGPSGPRTGEGRRNHLAPSCSPKGAS